MSAESGVADNAQGRVLVVDDVPVNVRLLTAILKVEGYEVITAGSGPEALERSLDSAPDVILLDVMMPGMDGFEVCRRLRADEATSHIPIVMVTALQGLEDRVRALETGADDFLSKPVDEVEVVARVRSLVRAKHARDELRRAYAELQRAESLRENLIMMLVHDLRTPLTTLIGPIEMLLEGHDGYGELNELQHDILSLSSRSGYRMLGLVNELLDIAKMENGELQLEKEAIAIENLIQEVLESVALAEHQHALEILRDIEADLPQATIDDDLIRRVLINLVGNAIKFTPEPGTITVGVTREQPGLGSQLRFFVRDTGPGIPEADRTRIFEKFGQVEIRKEGRKISTGLGLTFCKMAVEAHGGRIWVESEMGEGSTFIFTVPVE
jgi:signal transduction histidine kinase